MFHKFGQTKLAYVAYIFSSTQFWLLHQNPQNLKHNSLIATKNDSKIIIWQHKSKFVKHAVFQGNTSDSIRRQRLQPQLEYFTGRPRYSSNYFGPHSMSSQVKKTHFDCIIVILGHFFNANKQIRRKRVPTVSWAIFWSKKFLENLYLIMQNTPLVREKI